MSYINYWLKEVPEDEDCGIDPDGRIPPYDDDPEFYATMNKVLFYSLVCLHLQFVPFFPLSLTLFVFWVLTYNKNNTFSFNYFALCTNLFY